MRKENLTDKIFNRLTVLHEDGDRKGSFWICKCICGNIKSVNSGNLKFGSVQSCGCLLIDKNKQKDVEDLTGRIFNRLTLIERDFSKNRIYWKCTCECGEIISVRRDGLVSGDVQSCKCLNREITSDICKVMSTTHGLSHSKSYKVWYDIKRRCFDENHEEYKNYGARGIKLADYWVEDVKSFHDYVSSLENYENPNYSIDRINNSGNYEIGNIRWATKSEQARNTRRIKLNEDMVREIRNSNMTIKELSNKFNVTVGTISGVKNNRSWKDVI